MTPPDDPLVGVVLDGRYRVERVVGVGGFGRVYRAQQLNIDAAVAVKVLSFDASQKADQVRRFQNEASIISKLRHPNTLKLVDSGKVPDGRLYIATEFLTGAPLDVVLRARSMDPLRVLRLLRQICGSLSEAHAHGVVHRDLKPANIFVEPVTGQEVAKVLDFGVAKLTQQSTETASGTIFGTPTYMSPEQASGETVDARSDLYSVGVIAYEMLTGRPPFRGSTPMSLLLKHIQEMPAPPSSLVPDGLPPAVEAFVMSLLAKSPEQRPHDAAEMVDIIDELLMRLSGPALAVRSARRLEARATPTIEASGESAIAETIEAGTSAPPALDPEEDDDIPAYYATGRRPMLLLLPLLAVGGLGAWMLWPADGPVAVADPDAGVASHAPPVVDAAPPPPPVDAPPPLPPVDAPPPPPPVDAGPDAQVEDRVVCRWITRRVKELDPAMNILVSKKKKVRVCKPRSKWRR